MLIYVCKKFLHACIESLKKREKLFFSKIAFKKLVKEITREYYEVEECGRIFNFNPETYILLQSVSEKILQDIFEDAYLITIQANRKILTIEDWQTALRIKKIFHF